MRRLSWRHLALGVGVGWPLISMPIPACAQRVIVRNVEVVAQNDVKKNVVVSPQVIAQEKEEAEAAEINQVQQQPQVFWSDDTIDQWIFGSGRNAQQARKRMDTQLSLRIDEMDRACTLSDDQKKKLRLAGQGDIKRLFDEMLTIRQKFDKLKSDRNAVNQIFQEIQPLQLRINAGIFNANSFYQKSVLKTLGVEQAAKIEQLEFERRTYRYHAKILLVMATLDIAIPMRDEQRQKLIKLIQEETRPPKRFGQYDFQVVMLQLAKLPEEKCKPIFEKAQWDALQTQFRQSRGMEQYLKTNGFLEEDPHKAEPLKKASIKVEVKKDQAVDAEVTTAEPAVTVEKNP